jgi:hypothetical protein
MIYRWAILFCVILSSVLFNAAQNFDFEVTDIEISDGQRARIIPLYEDFDFFMELISGEYTMADFDRSERFIHQCARAWYSMADTFGFELGDNLHPHFFQIWAELAEQLQEGNLVDVTAETLENAAAILPGSDIQVCLVPVVPVDIAFATQAYGTAQGITAVVAIGYLRDGWELDLASTVAHEYHHVMRHESPDHRETGNALIETLVLEGMAVSFAQMVVPDYENPTYSALTPQEEAALWQEIEPELYNSDTEIHQRYLFGEVDDIPYNAVIYRTMRVTLSVIVSYRRILRIIPTFQLKNGVCLLARLFMKQANTIRKRKMVLKHPIRKQMRKGN